MLDHQKNCGMFYSIKCFLEIELMDDGHSPRVMALMYVLKAPGKAVLYGPRADEAILIIVHKLENN
jgi:hypothetical protein